MKKFLYGTTALVAVSAAGAAATPASAQSIEDRIRTLEESMLMGQAIDSPFDLSISGYMGAGAFFTNADNCTGFTPNCDDADYAATQLKWATGEIRFDASSLLDNGMTVGARSELDLFGGGNIDETYVYVEGGFGRFIFGAENGAANQMHYSCPWISGNGACGQNYRHTPVTAVRTSTNLDLSNDSNKVVYFTPRFSGFQFGVAYTPENIGGAPSKGGIPRNRQDTIGDKEHDGIDFGANFTRDLGDFALAVSAGWETFSTKVRKDDPVVYKFGGNVSAQGFTLGGGFAVGEGFAQGSDLANRHIVPNGAYGNSWRANQCTAPLRLYPGYQATDGDNPEVVPAGGDISGCPEGHSSLLDMSDQLEIQIWTVGATYATGPWTVGTGYTQAQGKNYPGIIVDAGADRTSRADDVNVTSGFVEPETSIVFLGASYQVAPGVFVAADVNFYEDKDGFGNSVEAQGGGLLFGVSF